MGDNNTPPVGPQPGAPLQLEDILTQFAIIKAKDGRIAVQFPLLDQSLQSVNLPLALELVAIGLQTLAQIVQSQMSLPPGPRITVVPPLPPHLLKKP